MRTRETEKEHRIQVMAGIALREGAFSSVWITLCLSLCSYRSQFLSVRSSFVQSGAWPHVMMLTSNHPIAPLFSFYYRNATLRFTDCLTVTAWYGTGWPFQKVFKWVGECEGLFFNGVTAGTGSVVEAMWMNSVILSLPTNENALIQM